jgi:hypothetical protein
MAASTRTPVLREAPLVGALPAQLRRPGAIRNVRLTSISDVASNVPNAQIEVNLGRCGELALIAEKCDHREWSRKDPEGVLLRERARPTRRTFSVRSAFGPRKHLATNIPFDRSRRPPRVMHEAARAVIQRAVRFTARSPFSGDRSVHRGSHLRRNTTISGNSRTKA